VSCLGKGLEIAVGASGRSSSVHTKSTISSCVSTVCEGMAVAQEHGEKNRHDADDQRLRLPNVAVVADSHPNLIFPELNRVRSFFGLFHFFVIKTSG